MSDDQQQCPACGARNAASADWCTQCFTPFGAAPAPPPAPSPPAPVAPTAPPASSHAPDAIGEVDELDIVQRQQADAARGLAARDGRFREVDGRVQWMCTTCIEWNSLDQVRCRVCGTPLAVTNASTTATAEVTTDVPPPVLVGLSLVAPGSGHALVGQWGQAVMRALLALVWGGGGIVLLRGALASDQPVLPALPLLVGWLAVAVGSANDVLVATGARGRMLLAGRTVLWLVVGVIGATMAAAMISALTAVRG